MVKTSIICLIYKSTKLADAIYDSVMKHTPKILTGEVELLFVANDPSKAVVNHLREKGYNYITHINPIFSEQELFSAGYSKPNYITNVYRGYNHGILQAKGEEVVLINSDNFFSTDWLENLQKYLDRTKIISSTLVERKHPIYGIFPGAIHGEFGSTVEEYDEKEFLKFAEQTKETGLKSGIAYMPCILYRDVAIIAGLYPEGNIAGSTYNHILISGDVEFFNRLKLIGVTHLTSLDSISYHLKEGEKDEAGDQQDLLQLPPTTTKLKKYSNIESYGKIQQIIIEKNQNNTINSLLGIKEKFINKIQGLFYTEKSIKIIYSILVKTRLIGPVKKILGK